MGTNKSGWCITSHHRDCPKEFPTHICSCVCHGGLEEPPVKEPEVKKNVR
jgi:hypothetical protein